MLRTFDLSMTPHLEVLNLERCGDFVELQLPFVCPSLKVLNLSHSKVSKLNLGMTPHLENLNLHNCSYLQEIHAPVGCLKKLVYFFLSTCITSKYFEADKHHKSVDLDSINTEKITLRCEVICPLHPTNSFPRFGFMCKYDEPRSSWSGNLEKFIFFGPCICFDYISETICGLQHLRELKLEGRTLRDLWRLESLKKLCFKKQQFQHLPTSICMLKHLKSLELYYCLFLEQLPENICELECLEDLIMWMCKSLRDIPSSTCKMKCLKRLDLIYCHNIKKLPEELGSLECLKELDIEGTGISHLPQSIFQLKGLRIYGFSEQFESYGFKPLTEEVSTITYVDL